MYDYIISPRWANFQSSLARTLNTSIGIISAEGKLISTYNTLPFHTEMELYPNLDQAYRDFYLSVPHNNQGNGEPEIIYDPLGLPVALTRLDKNTFLTLWGCFEQDQGTAPQALQERLALFGAPPVEEETLNKFAGQPKMEDLKEKAAAVSAVYLQMLNYSQESRELGQKMLLLAAVDEISKLTVGLLYSGSFALQQVLELVVNSLVILCDGQGAFAFIRYRSVKEQIYRGKDENLGQILREKWDATETGDPVCLLEWDAVRQDPERGVELHLVSFARGNDCFCLGVVNPMLIENRPALEAFSRQVNIVTELFLLYNLLQEQLGFLFNTLRQGMVAVNKEGKVMLVNRAARNIFGLAGVSLTIGLSLGEQDLCPSMVAALGEVTASGKSYFLKEDTLLQKNGGKKLYLSWDASPLCWENGEIAGAILLVEDITLRRLAEEENLKVSKLESIGILAGGIAHDFNNFLATMLANIALAKLYGDDRQKIHAKLESAEAAIIRARELTQRLLTISKGSNPLKKRVKLDVLIQESVNFALSGSDVFPLYSFPDDLSPVEADEGQLDQVINNLVINAIQAMPGGGRLEVEAKNVEVEAEQEEHFVPLAGGRYVMFSVTDQGIGIPEKHLSRVFDPFFTTKARGSGLGLSTSFNSIRKHRGHISVSSRQGVGTTFSVYLPVCPSTEVLQPGLEGMLVRGSGRVLIMDDEPSIREGAGEALVHLGYEVDYAAHGLEAINLYREAGQAGHPYAAVILDLTIPGGMGGESTMKELLAIDPGVKAVVASGYSNDPVLANYQDYGFKGVLQKPFSMEELSSKLHCVLT